MNSIVRARVRGPGHVRAQQSMPVSERVMNKVYLVYTAPAQLNAERFGRVGLQVRGVARPRRNA